MGVFGLVVLIALIAVFALGFLWPRGSRKVQEQVKEAVTWLAHKIRPRADQVGDNAANAVEKGGRATQESSLAGRRAHDEVFDSEQGSRQEDVLERRYGDGAEHGDEDTAEPPR